MESTPITINKIITTNVLPGLLLFLIAHDSIAAVSRMQRTLRARRTPGRLSHEKH